MKPPIPLFIAGFATAAVLAQVVAKNLTSKGSDIVQASQVSWGALNPARGEKGPRAANLWNDRTKEPGSGFLVKFKDGFSSPPHIHNVTYRGVVISGLVHNDDPSAGKMWMPPGSFWTQPAGEVHITAAKGEDTTVYVEIDSGPYLVMPKEEAFDKGERPVNVVPSNLVWLNSSQTSWINSEEDTTSPEIAFLWGEPAEGNTHGTFLRLPKGFDGQLVSEGGTMRAVVATGSVIHPGVGDNAPEISMKPGEYFGLAGSESVGLRCSASEGAVVYIRTGGTYRVLSNEEK